MKDYKSIQEEEAKSWLLENPIERTEKCQRETARYPQMARQMGLNFIDTSKMLCWDVGAGPLLGISSIIPTKKTVRIDPLADEYSKYFDTQTYLNIQAEHLKEKLSEPDLIIVTNALDHFENPTEFLEDLAKYTHGGVYVALFHANNNAITHPHPAHKFNINKEIVHHYLDNDFETVWELTYEKDHLVYGWRKQPAHAILLRRINNYK